MAGLQWKISGGGANATARTIYYDRQSATGDYLAPNNAIGEILSIDEEIVEVIGTVSNPDGFIVNRGIWFTEVADHASDAVIKLVDVHRTSISAFPGSLVELFEFDPTPIDKSASLYYFVNGFQTSRARTDLIKANKLTDLSKWSLYNGATVTPGVIGAEGNPDSYRIDTATPSAAPVVATGFGIPDDGLSYHVAIEVRPRGAVAVLVSLYGGTRLTTGVAIEQDGTIFTPAGATLATGALVTTIDDTGFFLVEFDVANNALGNKQFDLSIMPGYKYTPSGLFPSPAFCDVSAVSVFGPGGQVYWGGIAYSPLPILTSGFEVTTKGSLPTPHVKVANGVIGGLVSNLIEQYGDLVGARITRWRTFAKHLDSGSDPDSMRHFRPDRYSVNRKISQNKLYVEWELSTVIDQQGMLLPGRQILRDYCAWQYRFWDNQAGAFDYTNVECPYTGTLYFDRNDDAVTDPSLDQCSKRMTGCTLRFGNDAGSNLPFGGFPGVSLWR